MLRGASYSIIACFRIRLSSIQKRKRGLGDTLTYFNVRTPFRLVSEDVCEFNPQLLHASRNLVISTSKRTEIPRWQNQISQNWLSSAQSKRRKRPLRTITSPGLFLTLLLDAFFSELLTPRTTTAWFRRKNEREIGGGLNGEGKVSTQIWDERRFDFRSQFRGVS